MVHHSVWEASEIWAVILSDAIFLLFLVCSADLESTLWRVVLPPHKFYTCMFKHRISTRVFCVNGKYPAFYEKPISIRHAFTTVFGT